jgi:hypothetical protein
MIAKGSAGPSGVERLTARKPGPRIAQRSVTMDCPIRNNHVRYREHIFLRENRCCCAVKQKVTISASTSDESSAAVAGIITL